MERKILLVSLVVGVALFFLGISLYYVNENTDDLIGNYLTTVGIIIVYSVALFWLIKKSKFLLREDKRYSITALYSLQFITAYIFIVNLVMMIEVQGTPVNPMKKIVDLSILIFKSPGYLHALTFLVFLVTIALIIKRPKIKKEEEKFNKNIA